MLGAADTLARCRVDVGAVGSLGELAAVLAVHGFAVFDGLPNEQALLWLASGLGQLLPHRDNNGWGITVITNRTSDGGNGGEAGFTCQALAPHTDGAAQQCPPHLVVMACARPGTSGGECEVVDGHAVYAELAETAPEALASFSDPRCAYFGGAAGILTSVFEQHPGGEYVGLRLRRDKLARFSPPAQHWLPTLEQAVQRHTITFSSSLGTGYVVNNRRWLHGRRAFTGQRVMCRVLVEPSPRWQIPAGFPAIGTIGRP